MLTPNEGTSLRNKRKLDDVFMITQAEYEYALARRDSADRKQAVLQVHRNENTEDQAGNIIINQNFQGPKEATLQGHQEAPQVRKIQMTKAQYDYAIACHKSKMRSQAAAQAQRNEISTEHQTGNIIAYDPNMIINRNLKNPFEAQFAAHQQSPKDLNTMTREEMYHHSITALPGEWTVGLPFHKDAQERIEAWRQQILPEDSTELIYWDDIGYWATQQIYIPIPMYDEWSAIGTLELYRWRGYLLGGPIPEKTTSWEQMLILEAQTGATILQELERRQQEIRDTKEVQCCVT